MRAATVVVLLCAALAAGSSGCVGEASESSNTQIDLPEGISAELVAAARANLAWIEREVDAPHVTKYGFYGPLDSQFVDAVITEYRAEPELLKRRLETLASMVFFSAPEVVTNPAVGRVTPFHGMDDDAFEALMENEDTVFEHHMGANGGSPNGVRPFSVCETRFLISISKGEKDGTDFANGARITSYEAYALAYQAAAADCPPADLNEWYNFRGLGGLRPSWLESNISDRFAGRMVGECRDPHPEWESDCELFNQDRLGYRDRKNTELALREVFYNPDPALKVLGSGGGYADEDGEGGQSDHDMSLEQYLIDPDNAGALVEDRNGDGIGEWLAAAAVRVREGARVSVAPGATLSLPVETTVTLVADATFQDESWNDREVVAGTTLRLAAGAGVQLTTKISRLASSHDPIALNAGTSVNLSGGADVTLEDGTKLQTPWGDDDGSGVSVRLVAALSLPVADRPLRLSIEKITKGVLASNKFAYDLRIQIPLAGVGDEEGGTISANIAAQDVIAYDQVDPAWHAEYLQRPDLGMQVIFADGSGCTGGTPSPDTCPILRRFYSLIDRHENFYQTYSSVRPTQSNVSQQPSPLVACSITLAASHEWDTAGTPNGGTAGFIYLMRIPFAQIFAGDTRSIDTLSLLDPDESKRLTSGPQVLTVQQLYEHGAQLDMSRVWLDIATLSNNLYESEHEVSKFGSVPAEQIEGILVIRRPAAMGGGDDDGDEDEEPAG